MHALNNFLAGPYVTQDACRRAAERAVAMLSQVAGGDAEAMAHHLHPATGFLSIDVINILGAGALGLHVEGNTTPWPRLRADPDGAALVNWNNRHWTVLQRECRGGAWVHTNSILGDGLRHGRSTCAAGEDVLALLAEIQRDAGGVALHRIGRASFLAGPHLLERESRRAMVGAEDLEAAARCRRGRRPRHSERGWPR